MLAVLIYSILNLMVSTYLYRPGIAINWDIKIAEADLRYGILHVRDHAETIAFYRGEDAEARQLDTRIGHAIRQKLRQVWFELRVSGVREVFSTAWFVMPFPFVVPLYFAGKIQFGAIAQAGTAAMLINSSFDNVINLVPRLADIAPNVVRLAQILEKTEALEARRRGDRGEAPCRCDSP